MKLREIGEFGLIGRIAGKIATAGTGVILGIGDDAAVTRPAPGLVTLTTTDMLLEGVHFDLSFTSPCQLGRKALAVNLSDIAAMGAVPRHFLLSLAIPPVLSVEMLDSLLDGMLEMAGQFGVTLIGGDTCLSHSGLVMAITLIGEQEQSKIVSRSGACPGDLVFVTGTVGDAALGLHLLRAGVKGSCAIERHLDPIPRVLQGKSLAQTGCVSAMVDISDGLLADLGHILSGSAVGARLELDKIPLSPEYREYFLTRGEDLFPMALAGGEDYELLFTAPRASESIIRKVLEPLGTPISAIGEIVNDAGLHLSRLDGSSYTSPLSGYDHFAE